MMFFLGAAFGVSGLLAMAAAATDNLNILFWAGLIATFSAAAAISDATRERKR